MHCGPYTKAGQDQVDARPRGSEKLAGYEDRYRVRQGNYLIVYLVDDDSSVITIYKIGHRKDVYR